jgi:tRNA G18 (ribose-2'-O)-methylase SpoU
MRIVGALQILDVLRDGAAVSVVMVPKDATAAVQLSLVELAEARAIPLWRGSPGDMRRMSPTAEVPDALAVVGQTATASGLDDLLSRGGAVWLMVGAAYPSNIGFAIRTAEVSGATGIVVAGTLTHDERSRAQHVSMGAYRLMPVLWEETGAVFAAARRAGFRIVALEDVGGQAPWDVDLTDRIVLVVGNEGTGIDRIWLDQCDAIVRIPMLGFVPSYNLQAALASVATERLRQLLQSK